MSGHDSLEHDTPRTFMQRAIEMMQSSEVEPRVGAVLVLDGRVISVGCRSRGIHAERAAIEAAAKLGVDVRGATLYSTLEPCISADTEDESCAALIVRAGIKSVYVGRYDTNPLIYRAGWKVLRDAGISLRDFDIDLRSEIDAINATFAEYFTSGVGPTGGAKFDYSLNGGAFEIRFSNSDERRVRTQWTECGSDSIYAYAIKPVVVALARHAGEFSEIDDPRAFDFNYTVPVEVGEIAVFVSPDGAALVKVTQVSNKKGQTFVKMKYEIRTWS